MSPNRKKRRKSLQKQGVPASRPQTRITAVGKVIAETPRGTVLESENEEFGVLVVADRELPREEIAAELRLLADELESASTP